MPNAGRFSSLTETDVTLMIEATAPEAKDKEKLKAAIRQDHALRRAMAGDDRVFALVMGDDEGLLQASPVLYFEVLLRNAVKNLEQATHTVELSGAERVAVFDSKQVAELLSKEPVVDYLAAMLASFTKVESTVISVRVKPQVWRRLRFNDMDIDSLLRLCNAVEEESRFRFYRRIADLCLFILGVYPEFAQPRRYASPQPRATWRTLRGAREYEEEGRRFYKLASQHPEAKTLGMTEVFGLLHESFTSATKPLNFVSRHYLRSRRDRLFAVGGGA